MAVDPNATLGCGQTAGGLGDKFASVAQQYVQKKIEVFKQEKMFFGKDGSTSKPGGLFDSGSGGANFLSDIMSFAQGMGDFDLKDILQNFLGNKFGINFGNGAFDSLQGAFKSLGTMLMAMHMTDSATLWNFVDYSRREVVTRVGRAITELDRLKDQFDLMLARYDTLTPEGVAHWLSNYTALINSTVEALNSAHDELDLLEFGMSKHSVFNPLHQQAAIAHFDRAAALLKGDGVAGDILFLCSSKVDLDGLTDEFQYIMASLAATQANYTAMPDALAGLNIKSTFGLDSVNVARAATESIITDIEASLAATQASTALTYSAAGWAIQIEGLRSIIENLGADREIDKTGPEMDAAVEIAAEFTTADFSRYLTIISDLRIFGDTVSTVVKEGRILPVTNFRARVYSNMALLRADLERVAAAIQSRLPADLDPEAGRFLNEARASQFDAWIDLLFTGDILGFLTATFGQSNSSGQVVSAIVELVKCMPSTTKSQPIMKIYNISKSDMEKAENSARIRMFEPFKQYRKDLDKLDKVHRNTVDRAKTDARKRVGN